MRLFIWSVIAALGGLIVAVAALLVWATYMERRLTKILSDGEHQWPPK